jgi:hypothetical protein
MSAPTPATIEITAFHNSQLSSFHSFLQSRDELTADELKKEIALHNTRMLKVVSDFNKFRNSTSPLLPTPAPNGGFESRDEWDYSDGVFTGGEEMRTRRLFGGNGAGCNKEGGRNLFASHHPGIFNRRKSKGYVRAGASTLFKIGGSGGSGGNFERRIFGYGSDNDSSMGSVDDEEEVTPSKSRMVGRGMGRRRRGRRRRMGRERGRLSCLILVRVMGWEKITESLRRMRIRQKRQEGLRLGYWPWRERMRLL